MASHYSQYFIHQAQNGSGMGYYSGMHSQRGHGLGSFLGGLFRSVLPLLKSGARVLGNEALRAGSGFLGDMAAHVAPMDSFKQRTAELGQNFVNRMAQGGNGIKRLSSMRSVQSGRVTRRTSTHKRAAPQKKAAFLRDIFG